MDAAALLATLPADATAREAADCLTYEQAVVLAESVLDEIKAKGMQRPYPAGMRQTLKVCAAVFAREGSV